MGVADLTCTTDKRMLDRKDVRYYFVNAGDEILYPARKGVEISTIQMGLEIYNSMK